MSEKLTAKETIDIMWSNLINNNIFQKWEPTEKDLDVIYENVFNFIDNDIRMSIKY